MSEPDLEVRITALEDAGWVVVSREPRPQSMANSTTPGGASLERYFRGSRIIESRPTLAEAVEMAEEAQARFDASGEQPRDVHSGLSSA
jgi:hypothetical protein